MNEQLGREAQGVLEVLAALSPSNEPHHPNSSVPLDWFRWLPLSAVALFGKVLAPEEMATVYPDEMFSIDIDPEFGERLTAVDQVRLSQRSLRVGWLFVAGRGKQPNGTEARVFAPLVTVPVRVERRMFTAHLVPAGDVELSPLIPDGEQRAELEASIQLGGGVFGSEVPAEIEVPPRLLRRLGRLTDFALSAADAAGFKARAVVPVGGGPERFREAADLVVVAGVGVYALHDAGGLSRSATLRSWDVERLGEWTAFHALYLTDWEAEREPPEPTRLESAYPLSESQRDAVKATRTEPITVVSGAAGTGKSHTVAAIGLDAVSRGESVLVTARSDAAIEALIDLFERAPGAAPVVFGSAERRERLAKELAAGQPLTCGIAEIEASAQSVSDAVEARDETRREIARQLQLELILEDEHGAIAGARAQAPGLFGADLERAHELTELLKDQRSGWRARRRRARARRALLDEYGLAEDLEPPTIAHLLSVADLAERAGTRAVEGVSVSGWETLHRQEADVHRLMAEWLARDARSPRRFNRRSLRAVAALATALRSGRAARRAQLACLNGRDLTRAMPLWMGTLTDVDDLLPPVPALFDLVIFDESSSIEQPLAASALLRASRAVVVGDPRQLRHVSFLSDAEIQATVNAMPDADPDLKAILDVRRNSLYDAAVGASPVVALDEHFRSAPHLVEFVLDEFYDGRIYVATRTPATQALRCVESVRLPKSRRDRDGVVMAEVREVIDALEQLKDGGARSVGVVTPFRAQADALEDAVLKAFEASALRQLDLRVGTAHAFQGNERDIMLVSLGVGDDDGTGTWRHVEDPHLLAVMLTRARRRMVIFTSADPPVGGPMARYLAQIDNPPPPPNAIFIDDTWTRTVFEHLAAARSDVVMGYASGRHVVDVCLGGPDKFVGIETEVHPDGPDAHIDRHLDLSHAGWPLVDAFKSRWAKRPAELAVELVQALDQLP